VIAVEQATPAKATPPPAPGRLTSSKVTGSPVPIHAKVPRFPRNFAGGPTFFTAAGEHSAGSAFLARTSHDPQVYVLTVHHLFGPDGGLAQNVSHQQLPSSSGESESMRSMVTPRPTR